MASLYTRATPRQAIVLRMIEGAVHNAAHAHPGRPIDDRMARSIAKRAAGTLTSQWGHVLAAPRVRSEGDAGHPVRQFAAGTAQSQRRARRNGSAEESISRGALHTGVSWRSPLVLLHKAVAAQVGPAKHAGLNERADALIDVLRTLGAMIEADQAPRGRVRFVETADGGTRT
jgi:hypothetical protein